MSTKAKSLFIPLTNDRHIMLMFSEKEGDWVCRVSDECLTDIKNFFESGHYVLDSTKQIEIVEA